jgi:hypothetical protein
MYGMNFHNMPELSWAYGYEWGLFLIILSTVIPVIWFKSRVGGNRCHAPAKTRGHYADAKPPRGHLASACGGRFKIKGWW